MPQGSPRSNLEKKKNYFKFFFYIHSSSTFKFPRHFSIFIIQDSLVFPNTGWLEPLEGRESLNCLQMSVYAPTARTELAKKQALILIWLDRKWNSLNIRSLWPCQKRAAHSFAPRLMESSYVATVKVCVKVFKTHNTAHNLTPTFLLSPQRAGDGMHRYMR